MRLDLLVFGAALAAANFAAAQAPQPATVTLSDVMAQNAKERSGAAPVRVERRKASASLAAVYGTTGSDSQSAQLRFDIMLGDRVTSAAVLGQAIQSTSASCSVKTYNPETQCVTLVNTHQRGDVCPASACWTGLPPPPAPTPATPTTYSATGTPLTLIAPVMPVPPIAPSAAPTGGKF